MSIEIHNELNPDVIVCKDLKTACNRLDHLNRHERKEHGCARRRWLVDPSHAETVEVPRPGKRLAGKVCVRGAAYSLEQSQKNQEALARYNAYIKGYCV